MRSIVSKTAIAVLIASGLAACAKEAQPVSKPMLNQQVQDVSNALKDGSFAKKALVARNPIGTVTGIKGIIPLTRQKDGSVGYANLQVIIDDEGMPNVTLTFYPKVGDREVFDYIVLKYDGCSEALSLQANCGDVPSYKWMAVFDNAVSLAFQHGLKSEYALGK